MDYKTVVHVYDNQATGRADILELQEPHLRDLSRGDQIGTSTYTGSARGSESGRRSETASVNNHYLNGDYHSNGNGHSPRLMGAMQDVPESVQINQTGYAYSSNGSDKLVSDLAGDSLYNERTVPNRGHLNGSQYLGNGHSRSNPSLSNGNSRRGSLGAAVASAQDISMPGTSFQGALHPSQSAPSGFNGNHHGLQNGALSDADSETSSAMKNSVTSFDSFQTKAMKAIRALDDVVANEPSELDFAAVLDTPPPGTAPPPAPPPPPPPPPGESLLF